MESARFYNKLNKVDGKLYVIEEEIRMPESGVYEAALQHDNVTVSTLNVYTGPKLTGDRIQTWALSTPSLTPWKQIIRIQTEAPVVYITYETQGDTVEAEDINELQAAVTKTQTEVKEETGRAMEAEAALRREAEAETGRAMEAERALGGALETERARAIAAETALDDALGNDPDFAATVLSLLAGKVDKEDGKQLSANDYSDSEKAMVADAGAKKHIHENMEILNKVTQPLLDAWDDAFAHTGTQNNPHGVTKAQIGLEHVENKSGAEIRAEMTTQEVIDALGYKPPETSVSYVHPDSGVTAGGYRSVTVDAQGHVTGGSNPTTLAGYGITDASARDHNHDGVYLKKGAMTWSDLGGG